jgi:hypothetical protein
MCLKLYKVHIQQQYNRKIKVKLEIKIGIN